MPRKLGAFVLGPVRRKSAGAKNDVGNHSLMVDDDAMRLTAVDLRGTRSRGRCQGPPALCGRKACAAIDDGAVKGGCQRQRYKSAQVQVPGRLLEERLFRAVGLGTAALGWRWGPARE